MIRQVLVRLEHKVQVGQVVAVIKMVGQLKAGIMQTLVVLKLM